MEDIWDIATWVAIVIFLLVGLVRLILHFVRPVTWRDGEGPVIAEDGRGGGISNHGQFAYFWVDFLRFVLPWHR